MFGVDIAAVRGEKRCHGHSIEDMRSKYESKQHDGIDGEGNGPVSMEKQARTGVSLL